MQGHCRLQGSAVVQTKHPDCGVIFNGKDVTDMTWTAGRWQTWGPFYQSLQHRFGDQQLLWASTLLVPRKGVSTTSRIWKLRGSTGVRPLARPSTLALYHGFQPPIVDGAMLTC